MRYYLAKTPIDFLLCDECIASTGYYGPTSLEDYGGIVLVAKDGDAVAGCVWVAISGRMAIVDYLAIREGYPGLAVRLLLRLKKALVLLDIKQVKYFIHLDNAQSLRIAAAFGGTTDFPYALGCVALEGNNGD